MMETVLQGEAILPIPLEDEFIEKVKDAVGHVLSWPRHLVIRCSDLERGMAKKQMGKNAKQVKEKELGRKKEKKRQREQYEEKVKGEEPKEPEKGKETKEPEKGKVPKEPEKGKETKEPEKGKEPNEPEKETKKGKKIQKGNEKETKNGKEIMQRRRTRASTMTRIQVANSHVLKMTELMVDGQVAKVDSIKVQCEDDLFGGDSYTYLTWDDFEAVFTMYKLTGAVITTYMMYLFEQIKNGLKRDLGICFVSPSALAPSARKNRLKNIEDASTSFANRLSKRKDNDDIILLPYNPEDHWVLGVVDMKTSTCFYIDSLMPSTIHPDLKQIIESGMVLYATQSGSSKRVKLKWDGPVKCPCQPGFTECGYYMLKFMKEIVHEGLQVLINKNVGGGIDEYTDAHMDEICEEWANFVAVFIYR